MGNQTNIENWAAKERLRAIERAAFWRGWVRRRELVELFGLSLAQASADMQAYQDQNPTALHYNLRLKRYEGIPEMKCCFHVPRLEDAITLFLKGGETMRSIGLTPPPERMKAETTVKVATVPVPERAMSIDVTRRVFLGVLNDEKLRVHYSSVSGNKEGWRWIAPRSFVFDGTRWHVRAWCFDRMMYRDFVLGRMAKAEWPEPLTESLVRDDDWESTETIVVEPHPSLSAEARRALVLDYGMSDGVLKMKIRRALRWYTLRQFGIREAGMPKDQVRFQLVK